jgi:hypothetical protein
MLSYIRFRWQLFRLDRQERRLEKDDGKAIEAAKKRNASKEEIHELELVSSHTGLHFQDEIQKLHSQHLIREASRLIIPHPELKESVMWDKDEAGYIYLSQRGINKLRADIRAERKARVELLLMWVPGVVGVLGALIGLVAVLTARK